MNFGDALEALKEGKKVFRSGWNGKGMFLFVLEGASILKTKLYDAKLKKIAETFDGDTLECLPTIRMKTADNKILTGWLASQSDMFAEDWEIL